MTTISMEAGEVRVGYVTTRWPEFRSTITAAPYRASQFLGRAGQIVAESFDHHHPERFDLVLCIGVEPAEPIEERCIYVTSDELNTLSEFERVELVAARIAAKVCRLGLQALSGPEN